MATYDELLQAVENEGLMKKIRVACVVAAEIVRTESDQTPNHAARMAWSKLVFSDPQITARSMMWAVVAQNRSQTLAAILGASDAAVQTAVNTAVDVFAVS